MAKEIKFGAEARAALESGVNQPVSYTHLDVYKRQIQDSGRETAAGGQVLRQ